MLRIPARLLVSLCLLAAGVTAPALDVSAVNMAPPAIAPASAMPTLIAKVSPAAANTPAATSVTAAGSPAPIGASPVPPIAAKSWLVLDVASGQILAAEAADQRVDPASLTKLLTAYLSFAAIRDGKLKLDHRPPVSEAAWKAIGSRMFIEPNKPASIEELLNGMIVQSGNDASIALAEAVAGSEAVFAQLMNREAQRLGMTASSFRNATGLPDPQHYSTAADLARLATRLIEDFPQFYAYYAKREYAYNGIRQPNRNRLLSLDPTVDGLKTGHTDAAGWCLIASAKRDQQPGGFARRLLTVVLGAPSESARIVESQKLLNWGFQSFDAVRLFTAGKAAGTYEVWKGSSASVSGGFEREITVSVPKGETDQVRAEIERMQPLLAPIARGQRIGTVRIKLGDRVLAEQPMVALAAVDGAGFLGRQWDTIRLWWRSK